MARKGQRNASRRNTAIKRSTQGKFKRTLSKACLSIAAIPVLLSNPASALAAPSFIVPAGSTRTSRVSLSSGLGLTVANTGHLLVPGNAVDLTADRAAGNISNNGEIFSSDDFDATAIDLSGGTAGSITNGAYDKITGFSSYSNPVDDYHFHSGAATGINIDSTSLTGSITNGYYGFIEGGAISTINSFDSSFVAPPANAWAYASSEADGVGININNGSSLSGGISNSGEINGYGDGVAEAYSSYSGYNAIAQAYGSASGVGLNIEGSTTTIGVIRNEGYIAGDAYARGSAYAYGLYSGDTHASATAAGTGLNITGSSVAGITNSGYIEGLAEANASAGAYGFYYASTYSADASAEGVGIAIDDGTITGDITNTGTITGRGRVGAYEGYGSGTASGQGVGIELANGTTVVGNITNNNGTIEGIGTQYYGYGYSNYGVGINISESSVNNITNFGSSWIAGHSSSYSGYGAYGIGIAVSGALGSVGTISNTNNATISGNGEWSGTGILVDGGSVTTIANYYGNIYAIDANDNTGIDVSGGGSVGSITNQYGMISGIYGSYATGINVQGKYSTVGSIINNSYGSIRGEYGEYSTGINVTNKGAITSITNNAGGEIGADGYYGVGISASYEGSISNITNDGFIYGYGYGNSAGISAENGGTIGSITNNLYGEINSNAYYGYGLYSTFPASIRASGGEITGTITNHGVINGFIGVLAQDTSKYDGTISGDIINEESGEIYGVVGVGALFYGSIEGDITNNGAIYGKYGGIVSLRYGNISGSVTNNGTIYGRSGIASSQYSSIGNITNNASGTISGYEVGIQVGVMSSTGSITNRGEISGKYAMVVDDGKMSATVNGSITNELGGLISGDYVGIYAAGAVTGGIVNDGTIYGGDSAIEFGTSYQNTITNTGLIDGDVRLGIGTLNLNGEAGRVTGAVSGEQGSTVNINGVFTSENTFYSANFNIASGGTFNMANTVTAVSTAVSNDGILAVAAGDSVTIDGDYTQTANGVFRTGATDETKYGQLTVTGTADLTASNKVDVNVTPEDTLADGNVLTSVLSAGTLNAGELSVTDDSALWDFIGTVNGNAIDLTVDQAMNFVEAIEGTPQDPVAKGAAEVLDEISDSGDASEDMQKVLDAFGALETQSDVAKAVAQTLPGFTGTYARMTEQVMSANGNRIFKNRFNRLRGLSSGDETIKDIEVWGDVFASQADQDPVDNIDGYEADSYGFSIGVDSEVSLEWRLGAAFTYGQSDIDGDGTIRAESLDIETFQGTLYAIGKVAENTELTLSAAYGHNENDAKREIVFEGIDRTARADFSSWHTYLDVELSHAHKLSERTTLTPSLSAKYTYVDVESYTETGAGALNLNIEGTDADSLVTMLDARLDHAATENVALNAHAGIGYDFLTDRSSIKSSYVGGGSTFVTEGFDPDPVVINGGVGIELQSEAGTTVSINYDIEAREDYDNQTAWLKFSIPLK